MNNPTRSSGMKIKLLIIIVGTYTAIKLRTRILVTISNDVIAMITTKQLPLLEH